MTVEDCEKEPQQFESLICPQGTVFCAAKNRCLTERSCMEENGASRGLVCPPGTVFCASKNRCVLGGCEIPIRGQTSDISPTKCSPGTVSIL